MIIETGEAVAPTTPRAEHGLYWGYNVRLAKSFSAVFNGTDIYTSIFLVILIVAYFSSTLCRRESVPGGAPRGGGRQSGCCR